jgi:hypothetical protein
MSETIPGTQELQAESDRPPYVIVEAHVTTKDGAEYVHKDLGKVVEPWAVEDHIGPIAAKEALGDVESWVKYVKTWGANTLRFLTWNSQRLNAILDYHGDRGAGRCQWTATHTFEKTREFTDWTLFAAKGAVSQQDAVKFLEDHIAQIFEPSGGELVEIFRRLKVNSQVSGDVVINEDGTSEVAFAKKDSAQLTASDGSLVRLPAFLKTRMPVLKGHVTEQGQPKWYELDVRVRVANVANGQLDLSFTLPNADATWDEVIAERVAAAKEQLGESFDLYRAQG